MQRYNTLNLITQSWYIETGVLNSTDELLDWVKHLNQTTHVDIKKIDLADCKGWCLDAQDGTIHNANRSFFSIAGLREEGGDWQQPIILQNEIGYLGILCKEFDGVMHFLMQAKIEPGNINHIQISPTIQATKSNFTQQHGGKKPAYLDYFLYAEQHEIVVDQIQSEQSSRFLKKRNRNIIVCVEDDVEVLANHRWMTLAQIKALMHHDNLVNMDTRTVLSCIPYCQANLDEDEKKQLSSHFKNQALFQSVFYGDGTNQLPALYRYINNYKMFDEKAYNLCPLQELESWHTVDGALVCKNPWPFRVVFCDIAIEGREVRNWTQPLFEAVGIATFGLILCEIDGVLKFVVRTYAEQGCFDSLELGATIQQEAGAVHEEDAITRLFEDKLAKGAGILFDTLLSEEGGRFYHEQNRNILMQVSREELGILPEGYFLMDFRALNQLIQVNNTVNIQLRNLLSVLEA